MAGGVRQAPDEGPETGGEVLVRVCDTSGRPRGTGFLADHHGTVITSHETVDGAASLVLHGAGGRSRVVTAAEITALPWAGLALVRTDGLGLEPLPVTARHRFGTGTYVRVAAGGWRQARLLGTADVTCTATGASHTLTGALELAIGTAGRDALRPGGGAAGGPVLDAATGAVLGVLGTTLHSGDRTAGFAVPLRDGAHGPLAALLARNAATVPAYGADLNLAGVLELTATSVGSDGPRPPAPAGPAPAPAPAPVERVRVVEEFTAFADGPAGVLGLVGQPGSGRTTELAALAARRTGGAEPAPTLWLRGADLLASDDSVADAAARALERAGRIVTASAAGDGDAPGTGRAAEGTAASSVLPPPGYGGELGDIGPERVAGIARRAGRALLLLLDSPEEMPPQLAHRLPEWTAESAAWLRETGTRLVVACGAEYWEQAGARFPPGTLHRPVAAPLPGEPTAYAGGPLPPCVWLGPLTEDEARSARSRLGIPDGVLDAADARHPLTLRMLAEVRAAQPGPCAGWPDRDEILAAYLDLRCLRVAVRLAAENGLHGTAVRRLAARVCGQVHEAARRCLWPGRGELDRRSFEAVFPWGPAPGGGPFHGVTGWASAVLTEGVLVPAGNGYRFADEEFADWIQGVHLDLDAALRSLLHHEDPSAEAAGHLPSAPAVPGARRRDRTVPDADASLPVPRHRVGPLVQALLLLGRRRGAGALALYLEELVLGMDVPGPAPGDAPGAGAGVGTGAGAGGESDDSAWWAGRLVAGTLLRVPDAVPYTGLLRLLADRIVAWRECGARVPGEFGPAFWEALALPEEERLELLGRLVVADGDEAGPGRYLDVVARLLAAAPSAVQPHLTDWFDDERPLPATPDATVATAAQALLYAHRRRDPDALTEALAGRPHRRADELLATLAEEEPAAVCRAVDRWAHDDRPVRRAAAMTYGLRVAPWVRTEADRALLRYAAGAVLARAADGALHSAALALLVRDPSTRVDHLHRALERCAAGDPGLPASALLPALVTDPDPVLDALGARLRRPDQDAGEDLRALADVTVPALARRVAALVHETVVRVPAEHCPEAADRVHAHLAAYVDRCLEHGPAARAALLPLVEGVLEGTSARVRAVLAEVLAGPGRPESRPLRNELMDLLLACESDPLVLDALLRAAVTGAGVLLDTDEHARALVHRVGLRFLRTPAGAARFDRALIDVALHDPGFAARLVQWLDEEPATWVAMVGPSARHTLGQLATASAPGRDGTAPDAHPANRTDGPPGPRPGTRAEPLIGQDA
ncbi:trypsin-like peptidase domain-containing protein [Streptomyces sp. NPDC008313]|uniref:trypsin-like peptidase domain-containing protein n=1 Tax=Streptomyces sp. NPDC008313 TaxID=3364826 RepID=UPI0036F01EE1